LVPALLSGAAVVVVIGLLEVMTVTSAAERMHGQRPDLNGELVGQGASSIVAGLNAGFPVSGSLSRSSLNLIAGGRTGFSSIVAGGIVLLTLLFLTPLLKPLPYPALAAAIVMAVAALVRPQDLITAWRIRTSDGLFGALTAIITIALAPDMVMGIGAGLAMSIGYGLWRSMHPRAVITTPDADGRRSAAADQKDPTAAITTGRLVVRIDTRISHLNATLLRDRLLTWLGRCPSGTELVIDCCAINDIDVTGCDMLAEVADQAIHRGCRFALADLKAPVRKRIERSPGLVNLPILARVDDDFPDILAERPVFADGI
jgi:SulP family sulfate permease